MNYYQVATDTPFNKSILTYKSQFDFSIGEIVKVPLGPRKVFGVIIFVQNENINSEYEIKEIISKNENIKIEESYHQLILWISKYYHYPIGLLYFEILPKKILEKIKEQKENGKKIFIDGKNKKLPFSLSEEQEDTLRAIQREGLDQFQRWLIHGVTGAGKTAIYIMLIKKVLEENKSVLFMLPEINLTPQFIVTLSEYLNADIALYYGSLEAGSKSKLWEKIYRRADNDRPLVIVGVRSSIFLPIKNLGLIIVDEEHDQSFKQNDHCTYNARDVAVKRASLLNIPVILGSATPMIESYESYKKIGHYLQLKKRPMNILMPKISIVNAKLEKEEKQYWPLNQVCINKIEAALAKNEQVIIYVNRLGYANFLQCQSCGHQFQCPNCTTKLKFFKRRNEITCQTCSYTDAAPEMCPTCMNMKLQPYGFGTEKVQEVLLGLFSSKKVERFDRDEIKNLKQLQLVLDRMTKGQIDILVGTQMISKGHNFKNVNLVIILGIDTELNFPDFRSNEKVFQSLVQVSGRAGRFGEPSEVVIATLSPENQVYSYLLNNEFDKFYGDEIEYRQLCNSPPYKRIAIIYYHSKDQKKLIDEVKNQVKIAESLSNKHFSSVEIIGPRSSLIEKRVNRFTWLMMLRSQNVNELHNLINTLENTSLKSLTKNIEYKIDIDPYSID